MDTEAYTITFDEAAKKPVFFRGQEKRMNLIDNAEKLKPVSTNPLTAGDFFGEARGEQSFPGPFTSIENKKVHSCREYTNLSEISQVTQILIELSKL